MKELPKGWQWTELESIGIINPRHPSNLDLSLEVSFTPMSAISENISNFNFTDIRTLKQVKKGYIHFAEGDVLIAKITPSMENGKAAVARNLVNGLGCGTTELHVIRPLGKILPDYIYNFIHQESFRKQASANMTGTAGQLRVPTNYIKSALIPLPPLNEQRRIVAKLEKILAKLNTCQQRLERIPTILKRFRQSVLAAACSGRLTADWRENNCALEWENKTLIALIKTKPRNGFSAKLVDLVDYETSTKILTLTATTSGKFKGKYFKYLDREIELDSHVWLHPKDILIQRGNTLEYVGVSAIYEGLPCQFIYPDLMMKIQVIEEIVNYQFIYYALSNIDTRNYFRNNATGTAGNMPKINQKVVMNTPIELPSIEEQQEIVRRVEALFKKCDSIEKRYQKAKNYTDKLTQSILAKAFRGELVPQDPNDEPAEILLERIRVEKAQQEKQAKAKKKTKRKTTSTKKRSKTKPRQLEIPDMN